VERVGIHQVMWFVMLKSVKDRVIGDVVCLAY
jgi:hypothetical protein